MSQAIWDSINPATTSGTQLATLLNDFKAAMVSGMSGTTRPDELQAGGSWVDTTNDPTYWIYNIFDGTDDIEVFRVNLTTGKAYFTGTSDAFEISRISADAVGPIAKFIKQRVAANGQLVPGDIIGQLQFIGRTGTPADPVVANLKVVSTDTMTGLAQGAYISIEQTKTGTAAAVEVARFLDGKFGIGTQVPDAVLHILGATGIKSEQSADDASGALLLLEKSRVTGNGSVQTSDVIGELRGRAKDSTTAKSDVAKIIMSATEGHTGTAKGSKIVFQTIDATTAVLADKLSISEKVEVLAALKVNALELVGQNVATAATIAALSAANPRVEMTGSTATTIQGINAAHASKEVTIHNRSTALVTLANQNGTASAADRMKLPDGADIVIAPESSVTLFYSTADTRWKVKAVGVSPVPPTVLPAALDIDWSAGNIFKKSVNANSTFTFSNVQDGKVITLVVENAGASDRTLTWPTPIYWPNGAAITTLTASKNNVYTFMRVDGKTYASATEQNTSV